MEEDKINTTSILKSFFFVGLFVFASISWIFLIIFVDHSVIKEYMDLLEKVEIGLLIFFAILDSILILYVNSHNSHLDDKYYNFYRKHGILKITFLKIIIVLFVIYSLKSSFTTSGASALIIAYCIFVTALFVDFIKKLKHNKTLQ